MANKKETLTPEELATAQAYGMTPEEFAAAYPTVLAQHQAEGTTPQQLNVHNDEPLQGPGIPGQPSGEGYVTAPQPKKTTTKDPPVNPFLQAETSLFNSLAGQYQSAMNIVNPYISGANAAGYATSAQQMGQAFAGGGVQAQNPTTAGILSKDEQAYAAANTAGQQGVQNAIKAQGPANAAMLQASPYQSILSALQNEAMYKTEQGAGTPGLALGTGTAPNPVTDPYGAAVALASESAGTGAAQAGASTVQSANNAVAPPTTSTGGSPGAAGGSA